MTTPKEPEGAEPMDRLEILESTLEKWYQRLLLCQRTGMVSAVDATDTLALIDNLRGERAQVAALEKERDAARDDNARLRAELADAEQQLGVLRPGGRYAWKTKAEAAEAQRDAAREALRAAKAYILNSYCEDAEQGEVVALIDKALSPSSSAAKCPCGGDIIQGQNQRTCSRCAWWEPSSSAAKPETR